MGSRDFDELSMRLRRQLTDLVPCTATGVIRTAGGGSVVVAYGIEKLPAPLRTLEAITPPPYESNDRLRTPVSPMPSLAEFDEKMDLA